MIQFNLLPDVKLQYIKARRTKRQVSLIAGLVSASAIAVLVLLLIAVNIGQKRHIKNLTDDIAAKSETIKNTPDVEKILTVQSQLESLSVLHSAKPETSRIVDYIKDITPRNVSIAELTIDFNESTIEIVGSSSEFRRTVYRFADTLKLTNYEVIDTEKDPSDESFIISRNKAFEQVVVSEFGRDTQGANYTIRFTFNPEIFDSSKEVRLQIPEGLITTRSREETADESELFQSLENTGLPEGEE